MDLLGVRRRRFSVREYHRLTEAGLLHEDDHVELTEGELFDNKTGKRRLFTADEYLRMGEAGILHEDDRVELIEGEILEMAAIGNPHFACVNRLASLFIRELGDAVVVHVQNPVRLTGGSEPEPDLTLLRPRKDFYLGKRPTPEDVLLLIEVSDATLEYDREVKAPLYAEAGVPELWIVDLVNEKVLVYSRPVDSFYADLRSTARGDSIVLRTLPGLTVGVDDVLG